MDGAFWQKLVLYGVCGLVAGYFSMRFTVKSNPGLFREKMPLSAEQLRAISENPVPRMDPPKLSNPARFESRDRPARATPNREQEEQQRRQAEARREERRARLQQQREERELKAGQAREEHEERVRKMREKSEARRNQRRAEQEAARIAEETRQAEDEEYLLSLSVEELEAERDRRGAEKKEASAQLRASLADGEDQATRSRRISRAVEAYMAASRALMQKKREQRELNR